jgi:iron complex outermembrane receptor protein
VDAAGIKNIKFHEHFITNSAQPFVEYQLVAIPRWTITAGIKDAYYNMSLKQYADGKTVGNLCPPGTTTDCPAYVTHDAGYNNWLPSIEANYRIKSNWSAYGQYGRGSVIPPSSVFDVKNAQVAVTPKPTVADTWQGGSVAKFNHVSLDGAVYYIHFQNAYSSYTPTSGPDKGITYYYANPASNTVGFEGEGNIYLTHGLSLFLNGTVGQAKYESADAKPATGTSPATPASPSAWVANAPHDTESAGLTYHDKRLDIGYFNKRVGSRWDDNGAYHQSVPYDPFWMTNLFFNYTVRANSFFDQSKIKLSMNNLLDHHDVVTVGAANSVTGSGVIYTPSQSDTMQLLPGRSIMITFQMGLNPKGR